MMERCSAAVEMRRSESDRRARMKRTGDPGDPCGTPTVGEMKVWKFGLARGGGEPGR